MRAVQAGDYAIGEFKFLRRLLLWHGRMNYVRIAEMIHYFFYKNFVFTLNHFFFAFLSLSSGQTIIDDWLITFYNMVFTAFPLGARACLDKDVSEDDGIMVTQLMPFMYKENRENPIFNVPSFLLSLLRGTVHGIINFVAVIYVYWYNAIDSSGDLADLWIISVVIFTNIIFVRIGLFRLSVSGYF
jgi:magnesium-transporting ATPase (P-type)